MTSTERKGERERGSEEESKRGREILETGELMQPTFFLIPIEFPSLDTFTHARNVALRSKYECVE